MNQHSIQYRLLWKDIRIVRPLIWSVLGLSIFANLLLLILRSVGDLGSRDFAELSVAAWIAIPNLFFFGAPSLLVGSEEEAGTNDWLRTVPIRWQSIWSSRLLVSLVSGTAIWLFALLQLWVSSAQWHAMDSFMDRVGYIGVLTTGYFSLLVLLVSFACIYAIRSPLAAKGVFVLVYVGTALCCSIAFAFCGPDDRLRSAVAIGILLGIWLLARSLAKRRMTAAIRVRGSRSQVDTSLYRPPRMTTAPRPSPTVSLLWQQLQQCWPVSVALVGFSWFTASLFWLTMPDPQDPWVGALGGLARFALLVSASSLGALVFYGDNLRHRFGFFADRGIAPSQLWWTRIAPPAAACVALVVSVLLVSTTNVRTGSNEMALLFTLVIVLFAFGQLVSQWVDRPILAFFAGPAYAAVALSPLLYVIERFDHSIYLIALTAPVLLIASWRLTQRWIEGGDRKRFTYRVVGYTALAILLPCLVVFGGISSRWVAGHFTTTSTASISSFQDVDAPSVETYVARLEQPE